MGLVSRFLVGSLLVATMLGVAACRRAEAGERGAANRAALAQQARISPDQATSIALASLPGTVQGLRMERDEGRVVYEVVVQPRAGALSDVQVDATSGQVLKTEPAGEREDEDDDDD